MAIPFGNVVQNGLKKPFAFLLTDHGDHGDLNDAESSPVISAIESIYQRRSRRWPASIRKKVPIISASLIKC